MKTKLGTGKEGLKIEAVSQDQRDKPFTLTSGKVLDALLQLQLCEWGQYSSVTGKSINDFANELLWLYDCTDLEGAAECLYHTWFAAGLEQEKAL
jgi:hypothetical protein